MAEMTTAQHQAAQNAALAALKAANMRPNLPPKLVEKLVGLVVAAGDPEAGVRQLLDTHGAYFLPPKPPRSADKIAARATEKN